MPNDSNNIIPIVLLLGGAALAFYLLTLPTSSPTTPIDVVKGIVGGVADVGGKVAEGVSKITQPITNVLAKGVNIGKDLTKAPALAYQTGKRVVGTVASSAKQAGSSVVEAGKAIVNTFTLGWL